MYLKCGLIAYEMKYCMKSLEMIKDDLKGECHAYGLRLKAHNSINDCFVVAASHIGDQSERGKSNSGGNLVAAETTKAVTSQKKCGEIHDRSGKESHELSESCLVTQKSKLIKEFSRGTITSGTTYTLQLVKME